MNAKIYVAMHKIINIHINSIYCPILVGSYNKESKEILRDDVGENISNKNENYCELTALYWIWKNSNEDIVGLCHYRRFLSKRMLNINKKYFLNESDINKYMYEKKYDMILPKKHYYHGTIESNFNFAPNKEDMMIVRKIISEECKDYLKDYDRFINKNSAYLCNVIITKKSIFDSYCKWLFKLLDIIENNMDKDKYMNDPYRKRMFGFLSERLLNVWIEHNKEKLKIKEFYLVNTESTLKERILHELKQKLQRMIGEFKYEV